MIALIKRSLKIYKEIFVKIAIITLLIWIPLAAISEFVINPAVDLGEISEILAKATTAEGAEQFADEIQAASRVFLLYTGSALLLSLVGLIAEISFIKLASNSYKKKNPNSNIITVDEEYSLSDCMEESIKLFPKVIWAMLMNYILIMCGMMFCFFPGVILAFFSTFTTTAVVLSGFKGINAVWYSVVITKKKFFAVVASVAIFFMASYLSSSLLGNLLSLISLGTVVDGIISILCTCIVEILFAFQSVFFTVMFLDIEEFIPREIKNSFNKPRDTDTNHEEEL